MDVTRSLYTERNIVDNILSQNRVLFTILSLAEYTLFQYNIVFTLFIKRFNVALIRGLSRESNLRNKSTKESEGTGISCTYHLLGKKKKVKYTRIVSHPSVISERLELT